VAARRRQCPATRPQPRAKQPTAAPAAKPPATLPTSTRAGLRLLAPEAGLSAGRCFKLGGVAQALGWDDAEIKRSGFLYDLRKEQDRSFG